MKKMKILAGITLYQPDMQRLKENIISIINQVDKLLLVDNGSENLSEVELWCKEKFGNIDIISNGKNVGVAKALNQMFYYAEKNGFQWILTLDQDSICPEKLISEYCKYVTYDKVATICPIIADRNYAKIEKADSGISIVDKCITSASLNSLSSWKKVGGFTEELFIDFVDHDYCAKLYDAGFKILRVNSVKILHEIGNATDHNILGIKFTTLNHSAFRKYYMTRNWIYYIEKHRNQVKYQTEVMKLHFFFIKTFFFETDKKNKMQAMFRGLKDGKRMITERDR